MGDKNSELHVNRNDNFISYALRLHEAKIFFLSFELKYLTPNVKLYIKLCLLKTTLYCRSFIDLIGYEAVTIFIHYGDVFEICLH